MKAIIRFIIQLFRKIFTSEKPENEPKKKGLLQRLNDIKNSTRYAKTNRLNYSYKEQREDKKNPDAILYLELVERKKVLDRKQIRNRILRNNYGKVMNYKKWMDFKMGVRQKAI